LLDDEKIELVKRVTEIGGEGFMVKHLDSTYSPGRRVSHSVKVKFVHTADVIVTSWKRTATTGSARLAVYDGGELVDVGGCSLIGKPEVTDGCVVEVAYSAFRGAMNQPRMMRLRPDKPASECTLAQFPAYSKEVV
jgi:ATP-dependent DNA ligase